ncbi:MAG: glycosyltransferase family 4 protein [Ignavibacteriaceae bacterium]|nr:glycosyltransferase family 4 protein [Ignavibacteriaceae bacterium]
MMIDIANAFAANYEECILLTGELRKRNKSLNPRIRQINLIKYNPTKNLNRLLTWTIGSLQALLYIIFKGRNADLFITSNPPFGIFLPYFCTNKYSILIYDIYPDLLINYKILSRNSRVIKFWEKTNIKIFANAKNIFTISDGMKQQIAKYVNYQKIDVISCWTDNSFLKPIPKEENIFIHQQHIEGKFIILYSGNVGFTHNVETLLDLADRIQRKDILFLIIGDGDKKKMLSERIHNSELQNVRLLPWQDIAMYPYSLSSADLAIVTLSKEASIMSVPSKLFDIMSVGSPILSIAEKNSEIAKIIDKYDLGICCLADQIDTMVDFIFNLMDNKNYYNKLRGNSLKTSQKFTPDNACKFVK